MSHMLQTLYYTGGIRGRNDWLRFEDDMAMLKALRERVAGELPGIPAGGWELLLALRHFVHSKQATCSVRPGGTRASSG